jgi:hypothetical protein
MSKSLPVQIASSLDAYFENRFQRNLANGVLNLVACVALLAVGSGFLISGWLLFGGFMLAWAFRSALRRLGATWIYRRNLPPVAASSTCVTNELPAHPLESPLSVAESTTKRLEIANSSKVNGSKNTAMPHRIRSNAVPPGRS